MSTTPGLGAGLYTHPVFKPEDFMDDAALDNALSDDEDFLESMNLGDQLGKIESQPPQEVPPREGLYSTPLSWEKPAPGLRMNPLFGMGGMNAPMLDPEQRRLLAIALNTGGRSSATSLGSGMGFGVGADLGPEFASLENFDANMATGNLSDIARGSEQSALDKGKNKEKASGKEEAQSYRPQVSRTATNATSISEKSKDKAKSGDRTAHNDIERKYRTNLKDRISELRDAVPSLRSIPEEGGEDAEADSQSQRGPKVSKGTVLTKATEYIHYLERRNKAIMREHQELARRLQAFEQLLSAQARQPFPMPNYSRTLFDPRGFC
ncbi:helix-loop-helix DNA-binding domain-containing protein [Colletotrichum higginsianum]|nr:helix-loop-helix DNA-binding domain-containing protein [Colletotrichum higginsianum]